MYYDRHPTETDGCIPVLAAQVGFEPTGVLTHNGFQDRALIATWVLCHVAGRYRPALYGKERKRRYSMPSHTQDRVVAQKRLELLRHATHDPKSCVSTIPPLSHMTGGFIA